MFNAFLNFTYIQQIDSLQCINTKNLFANTLKAQLNKRLFKI